MEANYVPVKNDRNLKLAEQIQKMLQNDFQNRTPEQSQDCYIFLAAIACDIDEHNPCVVHAKRTMKAYDTAEGNAHVIAQSIAQSLITHPPYAYIFAAALYLANRHIPEAFRTRVLVDPDGPLFQFIQANEQAMK
jgi:hypothetical protein